MSYPYGTPSGPQRKSRSPLFIVLGCGCAFLAILALVAAGIGAYFVLQGTPEEPPSTSSEEPTDEPTEDPTEDPTEEPTEDPTEDPTTEPTEDPTTEPTEDPTTEPTDEPTDEDTSDEVLAISAEPLEEGNTLDTEDEQLTTENGKFVRAILTIENMGTETIGLSGDNFVVYGSDGTTYELRYASFTTSGPQIEPGETATAALYVDVAEDVVIEKVSYTDPVGTGGAEAVIPVN